MNEVTHRTIRKFNPGILQSDDEVTTQFVVRKRELDVVLEVLRGNIDSLSCQHVLIVAPRGRGKTMLLARVAAELRTAAEFSGCLLPVRFMEESQEIFNMADFWLETLFHLAKEIAMRNPDFARELRDTHASLSTRWGEQSLAENAYAAVLDAADYLNKKLVLMVENLQSLSMDVGKDFGWKLRKMLQMEPKIMLLASATSRFKGLDDASQPFFELFRTICLDPLGTEECRRLWKVVSGDTVTMREMRPLEILTGGSPRLLVIIGGLAQHWSLRRLMEDLVTLIDDHTEYFRSHLEGIGKTERRVYIALIDLWRLSTPGEVAARARMDIRKVSTMLGRLVTRGAVIWEGRGNKRLYAASERLYCIYYKLRRERGEAAVVRNLIHFMAAFYSEAELTEILYRSGLEEPFSKTFLEGIEQARTELPVIDSVLSCMMHLGVEELLHGQTGSFGRVVAVTNGTQSLEQPLQEIFDAFNAKAYEKVIEAADKAFASQGVDWSRVPEASIARAFYEKAIAQEHLGDLEGAIRAYDEVIERFGSSDAADIQIPVAAALLCRGHVLRNLGDLEGAIRACDEVIERFGSSDAADLQRPVATALLDRGHAQRELGDLEGEIRACDEVIARFGSSDAADLQHSVAAALLNRGHVRRNLGDLEGAIRAYDEVIERFGSSDAADLQHSVAAALLNRGRAQRELGDLEGEIRACDEVIARFGSSDAADLQHSIAAALFDMGSIRHELGDLEEAIRVFDEVIERFGSSDAADLQHSVAAALLSRGHVRRDLGDLERAIRAYDEVVERFGSSDAAYIQHPVAAALLNRGRAQHELGDLEEAIRAYDEVVERFGSSDAKALQHPVAMALLDRGHVRYTRGDLEEAIRACDEVIARFGSSDAKALQYSVAMALINKGHVQRHLGDLERAIRAYDEVVERFGTSDAKALQVQVANALLYKGAIQITIDRPKTTLHTCTEITRKLRSLRGGQHSNLTWRERYLRARALLAQGKLQVAMGVFRSAYTVFVHSDEAMMRQIPEFVTSLIKAGASAHDVIDIISSDKAKAETLIPLVVALRQHAGETVRESTEVLQVAKDILDKLGLDT